MRSKRRREPAKVRVYIKSSNLLIESLPPQAPSTTLWSPSLSEGGFFVPNFCAEGEKKRCYLFFDGFRPPTPDCAEPNGDGRIPVSRRLFFKKAEAPATNRTTPRNPTLFLQKKWWIYRAKSKKKRRRFSFGKMVGIDLNFCRNGDILIRNMGPQALTWRSEKWQQEFFRICWKQAATIAIEPRKSRRF